MALFLLRPTSLLLLRRLLQALSPGRAHAGGDAGDEGSGGGGAMAQLLAHSLSTGREPARTCSGSVRVTALRRR